MRSIRALSLFLHLTLAASAASILAIVWAQNAHAQDYFVDDSVADGLVLHYKFDEPASTTALPYVGPVNGTLENGASTTFGPIPPGLSFIDPGVLLLDGANDRVSLPDSAALNLATDFTVATWVQRDTTGLYHAIYDSGEQANEWWVFIAGATSGGVNDNRLGFGERGIAEVFSTRAITDTAWHHVAVVKAGNSGTNITFFVDGAQAGVASAGSVTTPSGPKHIGGLQDSAALAHHDGRIDDFRLYNRALSAAEVQRLAQGKACSSDGLTWDTAFRDLHCALDASAPGDEIWIGAGIYKPGTYRFIPYQLEGGVDLYGGFAGTAGAKETQLSQRPPFNPIAPLTILSGDIAGNDPAIPFGAAGLYTDNTNTILFAPAGITTSIDGLGVLGGNASYTSGSGDGALGGGLRVLAGGSVSLTHVAFLGNQATTAGGALFSRSPLTVTGSLFARNQSPGDGGAIAITETLAISSSSILSNVASGDGGGIYTAIEPLSLYDTDIVGNAAANGGGLFLSVPLDATLPATVHIEASLFERNQAMAGNGGGISSGLPIEVVSTTFLSNTADLDGGGIQALAPFTLTTNQFIGNRAVDDDGGALYAPTPTLFSTGNTLTGNVFRRNFAGRFGGAAAFSGVSTLDQFLENTSDSEGGAIIATGPITVARAVFLGNSSFLSGALVYQAPVSVPPATLTVVNSLFAGNGATSGAGADDIRVFDLNLVLLHNTFADAAASGAIGGVQLNRGHIDARNNIWSNYFFAATLGVSTTATLDTNVLFNTSLPNNPALTNTNPITGNPAFFDVASGNFHIGLASSARNVGLDAGVPIDFDGQARPIGPAPDIGYDEATFLAPTAAAGGPYQGPEGGGIALDASASTDDGPIAAYGWDCTDNGSFDLTGDAPTGVSCIYDDQGAFTARLRVTDSLGETDDATAQVTVTNVTPVLTPPATQQAQVGVATSFALGSFMDPGADAPWQVNIDWGDGSTDTTFADNIPGTIAAQNHAYATAGDFTVTIGVRDKDNASGSATFSVFAGNNLYLPAVTRN